MYIIKCLNFRILRFIFGINVYLKPLKIFRFNQEINNLTESEGHKILLAS